MNQDTVSLLQPTVVVLRACGVCPSALRKLDIPTSNKIYGLLLGFTCTIYGVLGIIDTYYTLKGIFSFISILCFVSSITDHLVLIISAFVTSKSLIKFFKIMESVQRSLFSLNIRQPHNPSKKSQILWLVLLITPYILQFFCQVLVGSYVMAFTGIAESLLNAGTVCKIRVLLDLIDEKFDLLNWHFDDLNNRWPVFLPRPSDVSFRELSSEREWRRTKFINEDEDTRTVTAEKVWNFNKAHLKLVYASRTLNSVISLSVLFHIFYSVMTLSIALPAALLDRNSILKTVWAQIFCFSNILGLIVIFSSSSKVQEKAEKMALLVHDLLDEDRHSPDVVQQMEEFSMALLHRRTVFSAAGFLDVNLKLVSRIAAILAPIVLFLRQMYLKMTYQEDN